MGSSHPFPWISVAQCWFSFATLNIRIFLLEQIHNHVPKWKAPAKVTWKPVIWYFAPSKQKSPKDLRENWSKFSATWAPLYGVPHYGAHLCEGFRLVELLCIRRSHRFLSLSSDLHQACPSPSFTSLLLHKGKADLEKRSKIRCIHIAWGAPQHSPVHKLYQDAPCTCWSALVNIWRRADGGQSSFSIH